MRSRSCVWSGRWAGVTSWWPPLALALVLAACVPAGSDPEIAVAEADGGSTSTSVEVVATTVVPTMRPTSADDLGLVLDEVGRPYDNAVGPQDTLAETRLLSRLLVDRGRLRLVDGDVLVSPGGGSTRSVDALAVNFWFEGTYDLRLIWQLPVTSTIEPARRALLGFRVQLQSSSVARWGDYEVLPDLTGGLIGGLGPGLLDELARSSDDAPPVVATAPTADRPFHVIDHDEDGAKDAFAIQTGVDDGSLVAVRGYDVDDRPIAVIVWHPRFPWRLAIEDGEPPPDVVEREMELIDCMEGRRLIDKWGRCT